MLASRTAMSSKVQARNRAGNSRFFSNMLFGFIGRQRRRCRLAKADKQKQQEQKGP